MSNLREIKGKAKLQMWIVEPINNANGTRSACFHAGSFDGED